MSHYTTMVFVKDEGYDLDEAREKAEELLEPFDEGTEDACAVYLIGDGADLALLHKDVFDGCNAMYDLRQQHLPWIPHVTAGYGLAAADLSYEGEIVFDRIIVEWCGESFDYPL